MFHMHRFAARLAPPLFCSACLLTCFVPPAVAGIKEDVGLVTLQAMIGLVPTGAGVPVAMTEAVVNGGYTPMTELPDFAGKHFEFRSGVAGNSAHATWVAQNFFGLSTSISPGIDTIEIYEAGDYLSDGFLNAGNPNRNPLSSPQNSRVGNHSWISNGGSINGMLDVLQREDWIIERDEFIQVVGVNNGELNTNPIMSNAFNVIAVGRTNGEHAISTLPLGGIYTVYRTRPDIVAPAGFTSFSTPVVAAASALLVDLGHTTPSLSDGSITPSRFPGTTIYHSETSEVVKATLLAGASRLAFNSDGSSLDDYRAEASRQANNGLDKRFGAGQLNVHNSFSIAIEGEQNSQADGRNADVPPAGFDYDPHFGGANGSNSSGVYDFTAGWTGQTLTASLVWNARIDIEQVKQGDYANAGTLYDLDLSLLDITTDTPTLVASSTSGNQNTENIWTSLVGGRRYRLQVARASEQAAFDWNYGLAWSTVGTIGWRGTGPWNSASLSWTKGTLPTAFITGEHVVFSDWGLNGQVVIEESVAPGSVVVDNDAVPYTFQGAAITGPTGLVKRGSGQLMLASANAYAGATLIQAGKVAVAANGALGLAAGPTTVSPGGALVLQGGVDYSIPEPLAISGHGPSGQGALQSSDGKSSFAGPVTVDSDTTIEVANGGELALTGDFEIAVVAMLTKTGMGALSLRGGLEWGPASAIGSMEGALRLEPAAGSTVSVSAVSPTLLIAGGAVRVNAAGEDPFTDSQDPSLHADVINDSVNGLIIEAGSAGVDQLIGGGSTYVGEGAALTVNHIDQAGLVIGPGGRVTLRPGQGASVLRSLTLDLGSPFGLAADSLSTGSDSILTAPAEGRQFSRESALTGGVAAGLNSVASVPEPTSVTLAGAALALFVLIALRRRSSRVTVAQSRLA